MKRKLQVLVMILMVPTLLVGCSWRAFWTTLGLVGAAGAGAATVYYLQGRLKGKVDEDLKRTYEASLAAVEERGWSIGDARIGMNDARIQGRTAGPEDESYTINMTPDEAGGTEVSIRIGTIGDEAVSQSLFYDIQKQLNGGYQEPEDGTVNQPGTTTDTRSDSRDRTRQAGTAGVEPQAIAPPSASDVGVSSDRDY